MGSYANLLKLADQQIEIVEEQKQSVQTLQTGVQHGHVPEVVAFEAVDGVKPVELVKMNVRTQYGDEN